MKILYDIWEDTSIMITLIKFETNMKMYIEVTRYLLYTYTCEII